MFAGIRRRWNNWRIKPDPIPVSRSEPASRTPVDFQEMILRLKGLSAKSQQRDPAYNNPFQPGIRRYPPGVIPDGSIRSTRGRPETLAMDASTNDAITWAGQAEHGLWQEGIGFMGYPYLAELSQRTEYRRPCEIVAEEMTRKWIRLRATGDDDKSDKIRELDAEIVRLRLKEKFHDTVLQDGIFGLSFLVPDLGTLDDAEEQLTPLELIPEKIARGSLKGFTLVDPTWSAPNLYNSNEPWRSDFYRPSTWFLMGRQFHHTRLLITISRPVPDIIKPAYNMGGLSLQQMLKPYVDNWLKIRQGVTDLVLAFTTFVIETDLNAILAGEGGQRLEERFAFFSLLKNNLGLLVTDKEREAFQNVSAPLGGLDHLQAQAQEHMAAVPGLPLIKMFGLSPSGLNATADNEVRVLYDMIHARQERVIRENLTTALKIIQLSKFGEIDPEIEFEFVGLWELDEAGKAAVQKTQADTDAVLIESGVISPDDARTRVAMDPESHYHGLEGDAPGLPEEGPEESLNADPAEHIARAGEEGAESGANSGI